MVYKSNLSLKGSGIALGRDWYEYQGFYLKEDKTMDEITKEIRVTMILPEGMTEEEAEEKLYEVLYDGLCNNAEVQVDFEYI